MLTKQHTDDRGKQQASVLLHDYHAEYTQCLSDLPLYGPKQEGDGKYQNSTFVRCEIIWGQYALERAVEELGIVPGMDESDELVTKGFRAIFGDKLDQLIDGDRPQYLWQISGSLVGLERAFDALQAALMPSLNDGANITEPFWMPSGDDSVFDYWPNTMDMLTDFAQDLDGLLGTDAHVRKVWEVLDRMVEVGEWADYLPGGESEFEWSATERWGFEGKDKAND